MTLRDPKSSSDVSSDSAPLPPPEAPKGLDLEPIKAREAKASRGWQSMQAGNCTMENGKLAAIAEVAGLPRPWNPVWVGWQSAKNYFKTFMRQEDAEFVAAARTDIPTLIAEVERLRLAASGAPPQQEKQK